MNAKPPSWAVLIPVGPGEKELHRLFDTVESLFHHEPTVRWLVLVDDATPTRRLDTMVKVPTTCNVTAISNPRNRQGNGWSGGLAAGILAGFRRIASDTDCDFALKLDLDALVIAPFAEKIAAMFWGKPRTAMLGVIPNDLCVAPALQKLRRRLTIWRRTHRPWPRLQCWFFQTDNLRRTLISTAIRNGYKVGSYCQGGAYVVRGNALRHIREQGGFDHPCMWLWTPCGEDVVMTMTVFSFGYIAESQPSVYPPIRTRAPGLPASVETLCEQQACIIHSIKDHLEQCEDEVRRFFRAKRRSI